MLRKLKIQNFGSVYEPLEISLLLNDRVPKDYRSLSTCDNSHASKITALIGANGSGKTNILKSLAFLHWFVSHSFTSQAPNEPIPVVSHFVGKEKPTDFQVEFEFENSIWRYDLTLTHERVLHESLHRYDYRFSYIFKRDWNTENSSYDIKMKDEFDFSLKEAKKVRENASLVATAAQYNQSLALKLASLSVVSNVTSLGRYNLGSIDQIIGAAELFHKEESIRHTMNNLLSEWDLGLSQVSIEKSIQHNEKGEESTIFLPFGNHEIDGKNFKLIMFEESSGTRSAFTLLSKILPILEKGGLAIIDELESDLHPHMLSKVLDLFILPETNPHNAQLIFSTHSHELLNILLKEQIILVEKDSNLNTDAYRLDDVEGVRSDDNIYAKYMAGAYGAVPEI